MTDIHLTGVPEELVEKIADLWATEVGRPRDPGYWQAQAERSQALSVAYDDARSSLVGSSGPTVRLLRLALADAASYRDQHADYALERQRAEQRDREESQ